MNHPVQEAQQVEIIELIANKSNKLIEGRHGLTTYELRLLALAISRLQDDFQGFRPVTITFQDFLMCREKDKDNNYTHFHKMAKSLVRKPISIEKGPDSWVEYSWFTMVAAERGEVVFHFNPKLQDELISLRAHFTQLPVNEFFTLEGKYTGGLYELLRSRRMHADTHGGKFWFRITIQELRSKYHFDKQGKDGKGKIYSEYRDLKRRVILPSMKSIGDTTDMKIERLEELDGNDRPAKRPHPVESLIFHVKIEPRNYQIPTELFADPAQITILETPQDRRRRLEEAQNFWTAQKLNEELEKNCPYEPAFSVHMLSHGVQVEQMLGVWQVMGLSDEQPSHPISMNDNYVDHSIKRGRKTNESTLDDPATDKQIMALCRLMVRSKGMISAQEKQGISLLYPTKKIAGNKIRELTDLQNAQNNQNEDA